VAARQWIAPTLYAWRERGRKVLSSPRENSRPAPGLDVRASQRAGRPIARGQARGMVRRWEKANKKKGVRPMCGSHVSAREGKRKGGGGWLSRLVWSAC
jgi:hypothetical protein